MPTCPSCGRDVPLLCAEDGLCRDCSECCRQDLDATHGSAPSR